MHKRRVDAVELLGLWCECFAKFALVAERGNHKLNESNALSGARQKNESVGGYKKSCHIIPLPVEDAMGKQSLGLPSVCVGQTIGADLFTF